jgi:membrane protease YdiL (CAAX protease family)
VRRFFVIVVPVLLVAIGTSMGFQEARAGTVAGYLWTAGPSVGLALFALGYAWRRSELKLWVLPQWGDISRGFVSAIALFGISFGFVKLVVHESSPSAAWMVRLYAQAGDTSELRDHMKLVAAGIIAASFAEEIVWRGLVRSALEESLGGTRAWLVSALLYAVAHLPTMWALKDAHAGLNPMVPFAALGAGLVFGGMTRYYLGRLGPAMIAHALFDWGVIMTFRLYGNSV